MAFPTPTNQQNQVGAFIPTSFIWDVDTLYTIDVNSQEFKELLVRLYQNIINMANVINIKDSGYYNTLEFVNGQLYFPNPADNSRSAQGPEFRQVIRKTFNFGALPNTATKTLAHGITCTPTTTFTRIYGCASDTTGLTYIPLPYVSTTGLANQIELFLDATNINVRTGSNRSNFNITYIVVEFLQS